MTRVTIAAIAVVLLGVFAALAVTVVQANRSIDSRVSRSFDETAPGVVRGASVNSGGCVKRRLYYYTCRLDVSPPNRPLSAVYWLLALRDDGCWIAVRTGPYPPRSALGPLAKRLGTIRACGV